MKFAGKILCVVVPVLLGSFVFAQTITVTSPNGGENWMKGSTHPITWNAAGITSGTFKITLWRGGSNLGVVASGIAASQRSFNWIAGNLESGSAAAGTDYKIRVKLQDRPIFDESQHPFSILEVMHYLPTPQITIMPHTVRFPFNMPVTFRTEEKNRERHQRNCLFSIGRQAIPADPHEFLVGFSAYCIDGGFGCADQCRAQAFRARPLYEAARLRSLIGKTIVSAVLSFRHKHTDADPACVSCLTSAVFYAGRMGEANPPVRETRRLVPVPSGDRVQIDVTEWIRNWLHEEDPAYTGAPHNYTLSLVGPDESMEFNNRRCLSFFDDGRLVVTYNE